MSQGALPSLSLDQLIALNDEIAALARAGVPLDFGLRQVGRDMPGRLGTYATLLSERIAQGEPLDKLLGDPNAKLPRAYQAVVLAGLSTGRLPAALESLASTMRRLAELRRMTVVSLIYPLILLAVAWLLIAFTTSMILPVLYKMSLDNHVPWAGLMRPLVQAGAYANVWGPIGPVVLLAWAAIIFYDSSRATIVGARRTALGLAWLPWTRASLKASKAAAMIDIVGLAIEHGLPLDNALNLAAEATGDVDYIRDAQALAEAIRRGQNLSGNVNRNDQGQEIAQLGRRSGLPALLTWMLAGNVSADVRIATLRLGAKEYHSLAMHQAEVARVMIPVAVTCCCSGMIVFLYTFAIFFPYTRLIYTLSQSLTGGRS